VEDVDVDVINKCLCGKIYKHSSSLWKHKQKCITNGHIYSIVNDNTINDNNVINNNVINNEKIFKELVYNNISLITATQEFKTMIVEQQKQIQEQNKMIIEIANKTTKCK
jgi:cytidylate kinase